MAGRSQRAVHMMGSEPRASSGTPRSQPDNTLDVETGSGRGSAPLIQGERKKIDPEIERDFLEFQRSWTKW
eukprot:7787537-Prorocentrum_lima.AAC.1